MVKHYYAVIMAGGGGTRLWPLSRQSRPKQMVRLGSDRTLFQMAVDRLDAVFTPDRIFVVTVAEQAVLLQQQCPQIPVENYLIEPLPRGTASVVGLAAVVLQKRDPEATMAVLTADHFIENVPYFTDLLKTAYDVAQDHYLVTLGIRPTFPSTGYGYIQRKNAIRDYSGHPVFAVERFKEKPDEAAARKMIEQGDHDWNSGMFIWRVERILAEFEKSMPEIHTTLKEIQNGWGTALQGDIVGSLWPKIVPQTIDYGIMERANQVAVLPAADLGWNDVGSWDSLFDVLPADAQGNIILDSQYIGIESNQSIVLSENQDRLIAMIGIQNLIVVDTPDVLLICSRNDAQKVRDMVKLLAQTGKQKYL